MKYSSILTIPAVSIINTDPSKNFEEEFEQRNNFVEPSSKFQDAKKERERERKGYVETLRGVTVWFKEK